MSTSRPKGSSTAGWRREDTGPHPARGCGKNSTTKSKSLVSGLNVPFTADPKIPSFFTDTSRKAPAPRRGAASRSPVAPPWPSLYPSPPHETDRRPRQSGGGLCAVAAQRRVGGGGRFREEISHRSQPPREGQHDRRGAGGGVGTGCRRKLVPQHPPPPREGQRAGGGGGGGGDGQGRQAAHVHEPF